MPVVSVFILHVPVFFLKNKSSGYIIISEEGKMIMDKTSVTYREYQNKDLIYIRNILENDLGYDVPACELENRIKEMLSDKNYTVIVACDGEKVIGFIGAVSYITFEMKQKVAKIIALAVSEEYRNNGVGTDLLKEVELRCRDNDISIILLNSGLSRENAHKFYEAKGYSKKSFGFVKVIKK